VHAQVALFAAVVFGVFVGAPPARADVGSDGAIAQPEKRNATITADRGCWVPSLHALTGRGARFSISEPAVFLAVDRGASKAVWEAARVLAEQLRLITGRPFNVREPRPGEEGPRIVIGTVTALPEFAGQLHRPEAPNHEGYLIRSEPTQLWIVAESDQGIRHAVWDLLHQLGYRHYFPGPTWRIVPKSPNLLVQTDRVCRPAFQQRRLFFGGGGYSENKAEFEEWSRENRLGGLTIATNHSYQRIVAENQSEFAAHPEYLARGETAPSPKFCVTEPGLVDLVRRYAAQYFTRHPDSVAISLEPSDRGGWDGCPGDDALGSTSNRVVSLANAVARSLPSPPAAPRFVGMLAYYEHSAPPTIALEPNVVVFVATAFSRSGLSFFDTLRGWQAKGLRPGGTWAGVREYYSVNAWDRDRPGRASASSPSEIAASLGKYHAVGARLLDAEIGDGWGPHGLGYWVAAASLWSADEPAPTQSYVDDFLRNAFGKAHDIMEQFYARIGKPDHPLLCKELVGELYRLLASARRIEHSPVVAKRLHALAKYLHYLDLWLDYDFKDGVERQSAFEALMKYAYRVRREHMFDSFSLRRDLQRDRSVTVPSPEFWRTPESDPWRDTAAVTDSELHEWGRTGSQRTPLPQAEPLDAPETLGRLTTRPPTSGTALHHVKLRGQQRLYLLIDAAKSLELGIEGGAVRANGQIRLTLCPTSSATDGCQTQSIPGDRKAHKVSFQTPTLGHYVLDIDDSSNGVTVSWPAGTALALPATQQAVPALWRAWTLYLYVPRGTREVVFYSSGGKGVLRDAQGQIAYRAVRQPGVVRVPVRPGQDAQPWKFESNTGYRLPLNIPPWFAAAPEELLLPARVLGRSTPSVPTTAAGRPKG